MNRSAMRQAASTVLAVLLCIILSPSFSLSARTQDQNAQVIEMTAKKYEFSASPIHLKKDQKVQLRITATDHDHGVKIPVVPDGADKTGTAGLVFASFQDCWKIKKGETVTIDFVAQTPGTYTFKCCVDCGLGHRRMKGQIIVDE